MTSRYNSTLEFIKSFGLEPTEEDKQRQQNLDDRISYVNERRALIRQSFPLEEKSDIDLLIQTYGLKVFCRKKIIIENPETTYEGIITHMVDDSICFSYRLRDSVYQKLIKIHDLKLQNTNKPWVFENDSLVFKTNNELSSSFKLQ